MMSPYSSDSKFNLSCNICFPLYKHRVSKPHLKSLVDPLTDQEDDLEVCESSLVRSPGVSDGVASFKVLYGATDDD